MDQSGLDLSACSSAALACAVPSLKSSSVSIACILAWKLQRSLGCGSPGFNGEVLRLMKHSNLVAGSDGEAGEKNWQETPHSVSKGLPYRGAKAQGLEIYTHWVPERSDGGDEGGDRGDGDDDGGDGDDGDDGDGDGGEVVVLIKVVMMVVMVVVVIMAAVMMTLMVVVVRIETSEHA